MPPSENSSYIYQRYNFLGSNSQNVEVILCAVAPSECQDEIFWIRWKAPSLFSIRFSQLLIKVTTSLVFLVRLPLGSGGIQGGVCRASREAFAERKSRVHTLCSSAHEHIQLHMHMDMNALVFYSTEQSFFCWFILWHLSWGLVWWVQFNRAH